MITSQIMIEKETIEGTTQNDGGTRIRIDNAQYAKGTGTTTATPIKESIAEKNVGNRPENTNGR